MKRASVVILVLALVVPAPRPLWGMWASHDPESIAAECPVVVTGEIVKIDEGTGLSDGWVANYGSIDDPTVKGPLRVVDVACIKIVAIHKNLIDAPIQVGGIVHARMCSRKDDYHVSLDLRYKLGTKAMWMLYLGDDAKFYINYRPEQKQPVGSEKTIRLAGGAVALGGEPVHEDKMKWWIARQQKQRAEHLKLLKAERDRAQARREAAHTRALQALKTIHENGELRQERLSQVLEFPDDARRALIVWDSLDFNIEREDNEKLLTYLARKDPSAELRVWAAARLGYRHNTMLSKPLWLEMLNDTEPTVRWSAVKNLSRYHDAETVDAVARLLDDEKRTVVMTAVEALGKMGDRRYVAKLIGMYEKSDRQASECPVFGKALALLGEDDFALGCFRKAMSGESLHTRIDAVKILKASRAKAVVGAIMETLIGEMRWTVDRARTRHANDAALRAMVQVLTDRTNEKHGMNVAAWLAWWKDAAKGYGAEAIKFNADEVEKLQTEYQRLLGKARD